MGFIQLNVLNQTEPLPAVGIDLGTTNSLAAVWENGRPVVLRPEGDNGYVPSCVYFPERGAPIRPNARAADSLTKELLSPASTLHNTSMAACAFIRPSSIAASLRTRSSASLSNCKKRLTSPWLAGSGMGAGTASEPGGDERTTGAGWAGACCTYTGVGATVTAGDGT